MVATVGSAERTTLRNPPLCGPHSGPYGTEFGLWPAPPLLILDFGLGAGSYTAATDEKLHCCRILYAWGRFDTAGDIDAVEHAGR